MDLYRYDESWELDVAHVTHRLYEEQQHGSLYSTEGCEQTSSNVLLIDHVGMLRPKSNTMILDLRARKDFQAWSLPESKNLSLNTLNSKTTSPFEDANILEKQWLELESIFNPESVESCLFEIRDRVVLVLCYDGNTSRVATSVLRAKRVDAYSLKGGTNNLLSSLEPSETHFETSPTANDCPLPTAPVNPSGIGLGALSKARQGLEREPIGRQTEVVSA